MGGNESGSNRVSELRTDQQRLWDAHMEMAVFGATPKGGMGRLALTDDDKKARDLFVQWSKEAGCEVRVDVVGNIFARRLGTCPTAAPVMTGSHLDTQPLGGRFDGILGVLSGLEVVRTFNDRGVQHERSIDVVCWTDEEGSRFGAGCVGSNAFIGKRSVVDTLAMLDAVGNSIGDELQRIGYAGSEEVGGFEIDSFFEVHIEQGPILESAGLQIGAVEGAQASTGYMVTVTGEEGHAGTLPMIMRKDAMHGAARMIDAVDNVAFDFDPHPVITVGHLRVRPNSRNTIPGQVIFSIDSRHPDNDVLAEAGRMMKTACEVIANERGLGLDIQQTSHRDAVTFDPACVQGVRDASDLIGIPSMDIFSGAGHDAINLSHVCPSGMIFIPCEDGISHNELENARPEDLTAGTNVLMHALLQRAGRV
ncbi:MAG: Zn-dependent hydrolase [Alphaproteobacteria bacterium]|nr:Zn-dependent hydrolase [Alphaproteobacteria bacterium]